VRVLVLLLAACSIDEPGESPSRYEYCFEAENHREGGFNEAAFRTCLEGPGARAADAGAD
jgi:hypothetical protein